MHCLLHARQFMYVFYRGFSCYGQTMTVVCIVKVDDREVILSSYRTRTSFSSAGGGRFEGNCPAAQVFSGDLIQVANDPKLERSLGAF